MAFKDRLTKVRRVNQYHDYIHDHIQYVIRGYNRYMKIWKLRYPKLNYKKLEQQIQAHDHSKYDDEEFTAYKERFFPEVPLKDGEKPPHSPAFDKAWLHHIHNNPHHPEHWVLYDDGIVTTFDMPDEYIIEMVCDWWAMSETHNNKLWDWWESTGRNKPMTPHTAEEVNWLIYKIKEYEESIFK